MNKTKLVPVIACVSAVLVCLIYYTKYVSQAIYDVRVYYPQVENCSAKKVDAAPEEYFVYYYGDYEDLAEMEVVKVTWQLSNITNGRIDADDFWASYYGTDGSYLYVMEKDDEGLAVSDYENRKIIPPGKQAVYTEYVLVPEGSHEMEAKPGYTAIQTGGVRKSFTIAF